MPKVSVILPTYNRQRWLRPAVDSVFAQSFSDWELVVADDGSGDETRSYLDALESRRVKVLYLAHSGNPSQVRNAAIRAAGGDYVAFLDSDDLWAPEKLTVQMARLRQSDRFRWSYTGFNRIDTKGRLLPESQQKPAVLRDGWIFEMLLALEIAIPMPTLVAERALIEEVGGFDEEQRFGEFHDLCLRLSLQSEVASVGGDLCSLRVHTDHYSGDRMASQHAWMRLYEKFHALAPTSESRACCRRMRARTALNLAGLYANRGDAFGTWRTLHHGQIPSPAFWYSGSGAFLRALVQRGLRTLRHSSDEQNGVR